MNAPRFVGYQSGGMAEWMVARGPETGLQLLIIQPLFEEMNRCRAILAAVQRGLADAGVGSWLVDLPGTGESERALETVHFRDWRQAAADAAREIGSLSAVASVRGGCLLDDVVDAPRWRLSPVTGAALVRDLTRATPGDRVRLGGYLASARLIQRPPTQGVTDRQPASSYLLCTGAPAFSTDSGSRSLTSMRLRPGSGDAKGCVAVIVARLRRVSSW